MTAIGFRELSAPRGQLQGWSGVDAGGVLTLDDTLYRSISAELEDVFRRYVDAARDLWAAAPARFAQRVGLGERLAAGVPVRWDFDATAFCRIDFLLDGGAPTVLELNFGTSAGGSIDFEAWVDRAGASTDDGPNRGRMRWVARRAHELGARRVLIPVWPWLASEDPEGYLASTCAHLREFGAVPILVPLSEVLDVADRTRDVLLRLFAIQDVLAHGLDPRGFGYGPGSPLRWLCGEFSTALSSKAVLASRALQRSGARAIPRTAVLGPSSTGLDSLEVSDAVASQSSLVLKPVGGLGGAGVTFGPATTPETWKALCTDAGRGGWIAQQVAIPDVVPTPHGPAAVVWGLYLVQGRAAGVLARFLPSGQGHQVINGHTGAMLTAAVPS